ncbi:MAG: hypothetical protein FWD19_00950, partial [Defluviitaleaceae bacterium]|nr:hypothetical protein [Defluviitaleaceae bacterium]
MKKFFPLFFAFAIIFFVHANAETSPRMAPNMYVDWDYFSPDGYDAMSVDWFCEQDAKNTYWAVLGWDRGYAGFQNVGGNYVLLISLWNLGADLRPISDDTTVPAYRPTIEYSKDRTGGDFGGEGTGKNIFTNFDWQSEKWYTMRVQ